MSYIKPEDIEWKKVKYLKEPLGASPQHATWKYEFWLNEPLASWDVFDYWEKERIASMEKHLRKGEILFDVGSEQGWLNLAYAEMVGPENMVLIEPTNYDKSPLHFYDGLFSNKTTDDRTTSPHFARWWPQASTGDLIDRNKYQYIHENTENVPEMKIDDYVESTGVVPDAITMDTEGSELLILKGAEKTLEEYHPQLFISVHDDLAERDYGVKPGETIDYLKSLGYQDEWLATDHESHHRFWYVI